MESSSPEESEPEVWRDNKRRRQSYDTRFKMMVVDEAEASNNCQAARKYGVIECNVRRWRVQKDHLKMANRKRKAFRGPRSGRFKEIDRRICEFVTEKRNNGLPVSRTMIRQKALDFAKELNIPPTKFKASIGWCNKTMRRSGIALRHRPRPIKHLPLDLDEKLHSFQSYLIGLRKKHSYTLNQIGSADQVPVFLDMHTSVTVNKNGESSVIVKSTGNETNRVTVMLACLADGTKLPPYVILKRKTMPNEIIPAGIVVRAQEKGCMESELVVDWLKVVWGTQRSVLRRKRNVLIVDSFPGHLTNAVKTQVKKMNGDLVIIPAGMTSQLQVLDAVNKPFTYNLRRRYADWLLSGNDILTPSGEIKRPAIRLLCEWILHAWDEITPESIISSFKKCWTTNPLDGSEIDVQWEEMGPQCESDGDHSGSEDGCLPADVQRMQIKEEAPEEEWRPGVDQQDPEPLTIKEEQEEVKTSLDGEQLNMKEETDPTSCSFTPVPLKSEDDEEKPLFSQLHQHQMKDGDLPSSSSADQMTAATGGEDFGGEETPRNPDGNTDEEDSSSSETEDSEDDEDTDEEDSSSSDIEDSDSDWSPESSGNADNKCVSCSECGKQFVNKRSLQRHVTCHSRVRSSRVRSSSDKVQKKCVGVKNNVDSDRKVQTGRKPLSCDDCGKTFRYKCHLNDHRSIHTGEKRFGCNVCGKAFNYKSLLKIHMSSHTGQRPFSCDVCGKAFPTKSHLKPHMRIHTGQKPFACDVCEKRFGEKGSLTKHMRSHTGEKPFGCDVYERFNERSSLKTPIRILGLGN